MAVPFREILRADGTLDIYPEVNGGGYFDIDYRKGELVFRATKFVGLIPISDTLAIHVRPRAPISSLLYMLWRSGLQLSSLEHFVRTYSDEIGTVKSPEELYVETFISAAKRIRRVGLLKKYEARNTEKEMRGRILLNKSVTQFYSRGYRDRRVFQVFEHTVNNRENQILKHTCARLLTYFLAQPSKVNTVVAKELRFLIRLFEGVDSTRISTDVVARETIPLIRKLPALHKFYEPAMWLSYLISTRSGVTMEKVGRVQFETVIVNVSDAFERYVRKLCEENAEKHFDNCSVVDGNRYPIPLFSSNKKFVTQPDYYFRKGTETRALADAKYKPEPSTQDRYEILAFCEALSVNKAAFICPRWQNEPDTEHMGTTKSGKSLSIVRINLAAQDMKSEELRFANELSETLGLR